APEPLRWPIGKPRVHLGPIENATARATDDDEAIEQRLEPGEPGIDVAYGGDERRSGETRIAGGYCQEIRKSLKVHLVGRHAGDDTHGTIGRLAHRTCMAGCAVQADERNEPVPI